MIQTNQQGVGLIEVLIALVVFALGVVGMTALQLRTLSMSIDSVQRGVAIAKTQDLADRIRSSGSNPGNYAGTYNTANCPAQNANLCADTQNSDAANCTTNELVQYDIEEVFCADGLGLDSNVVSWSTTVSCTGNCNTPGTPMSITTTWIARTADTDASLVNGTVTNTDGTQVNTTTDSLTLNFIP